MRRTGIGVVAAALVLASAGAGRAQTATPTAPATPPGLVPSGVIDPTAAIVPDRARGPSLAPAAVPGDVRESLALRRNLDSKLRQARRETAVPVPPTLEIEVLDPNADPLGNPAVVPTRDAAGRSVIDIPPSVLVHRYYYTGDRSFQGPMIPGGPTILVINHPSTQERLYVEIQMLPGAPRVTYTRWSIEYDYGPQVIALKFGHHGKPSIVYRQGIPFAERARQAQASRHERVDKWVQRAGLDRAGETLRQGARNAVGATADGVRIAGRTVATPVVQLMRATPLGSVFSSDPTRQAERERSTLSRQAEDAARRFEADIPTVR